jgi:hypothetical protein
MKKTNKQINKHICLINYRAVKHVGVLGNVVFRALS